MSAPWLFDLQVNGYAGVDFQQLNLAEDDLLRACKALQAEGPTYILLTLISDDLSALFAKFQNIEKLRARNLLIRKTIVGYHLEGPYLSPESGYRGAHPEAVMRAPDIDEFSRLQESAGGNIRLLTLAPEWPGSAKFIRQLRDANVTVSLGHTNANDEQISLAIDAGATLCTHLGNAVPQLLHRHDNVIQRLLARDELTACFIADGIHLPRAVLKNFVRAKPMDKVCFTTDCMAAAAASPGVYTLGELELEVGEDRVVRQPGQQNFAGSSLTMAESLANVKSWLKWEHENTHAAHTTLPWQAVMGNRPFPCPNQEI